MRAPPPRPGTVRTTTLGNQRQTLAVLGYVRADASPFERLTLAGRMLKEAAARNPASVALSAPGRRAAARASLEALLAAALAQAFALPSFRSAARERARACGASRCSNGAGVDTRYAAAVARGTNLTRWLTALPPNILDARGYRRAIARAGAPPPPTACAGSTSARCAAPAPVRFSPWRPATRSAAPASHT